MRASTAGPLRVGPFEQAGEPPDWRLRLHGRTRNDVLRERLWLLVLCLHAVLALAIRRWESLAQAYAWGTFALGLCVVVGRESRVRAASFASYIAGAEVLWRMTRANPVWEYGKYTSGLLLLLVLLNEGLPMPPSCRCGLLRVLAGFCSPDHCLAGLDRRPGCP